MTHVLEPREGRGPVLGARVDVEQSLYRSADVPLYRQLQQRCRQGRRPSPDVGRQKCGPPRDELFGVPSTRTGADMDRRARGRKEIVALGSQPGASAQQRCGGFLRKITISVRDGLEQSQQPGSAGADRANLESTGGEEPDHSLRAVRRCKLKRAARYRARFSRCSRAHPRADGPTASMIVPSESTVAAVLAS